MKSNHSLPRLLVLAAALTATPWVLAQDDGAEAAPVVNEESTPAPAENADASAVADATDAPAAESAPAEAEATDAAVQPPPSSELMPLATTQALIFDFAEATARAIAVGERGQILLSESRQDWRQVAGVPTRANLNAVTTVGDAAWAVGQDGTIVHSADGGQTWVLQRSDPWRPLGDDEEFNPRQGVPLLDVLMLDAQRGFAVGAYSLLLRTEDGGNTWEEISVHGESAGAADEVVDEAAAIDETPQASEDNWTFDQSDLELEEESDPHLNAIARTGDGSLFIVAERGAAYRSRDEGRSWERLQLPYEGSMFGVIGYDGQRVLAFGMRGNAFESDDLGDTWTTLDTGTTLSLMGGTALPQGGAALVGANGVVVMRTSAEAPLQLHTYQNKAQETPVLAGVLAQSASQLVVSGEKGVGTYSVPAAAAQ